MGYDENDEKQERSPAQDMFERAASDAVKKTFRSAINEKETGLGYDNLKNVINPEGLKETQKAVQTAMQKNNEKQIAKNIAGKVAKGGIQKKAAAATAKAASTVVAAELGPAVGIALAIAISILIIVSGFMVLYNSVCSLFMPSIEVEGRTGYDDVGEKLVPLYDEFNAKIERLCNTADSALITYENPSNFKDIVRIYTVKAALGEQATPTLMSLLFHRDELKDVFNNMMYETHKYRTERYTAVVDNRRVTVSTKIIEIHIYNLTEAQYIEKYGFSEEEKEMYKLYNESGLKELFDGLSLNEDIALKYDSVNSTPVYSGEKIDLESLGLTEIVNMPATCSNEEYVENWGKVAIQLYPQYPILPSLTIAQAIWEGGWRNGNQSGLARNHNNFFGMKWWSGCPWGYVEMDTKEYVSGKYITIKAKFLSFGSFTEGAVGRMEFMKRNEKAHYKGIFGEKSFANAVQILVKGGYATDPNYAKKLTSLYNQYDLGKYDQAAFEYAEKKKTEQTVIQEGKENAKEASGNGNVIIEMIK